MPRSSSLALDRTVAAERRPVTERVVPITRGASRSADDDPLRRDQALVERFQAGDQAAFGEIYRLHYGQVLRIALRMVRSRATAEDITQGVFVRAHRALHRFEARSKLSTWFYRVAFNACADHLKSGWNRLERSAPEGLLERRESSGPSPYESFEAEQRRALVTEAIQRLPEQYRMVVILRDIEDRPYAEMAEILGLPITTMKMRAIRGRQMLARLVQRMCEP